MQALQVRAAAALALLLCSLAVGQASECTPVGSTKLRFVTQLNINGCALFVHDTGASDGPHLAIEPIMCVTDALEDMLVKYDPIHQQRYMSIPVLIKDAGMLAEAQRKLQNVSSKPVTFTDVTELKVLTDSNSLSEAVRLIWTPEEPVAFVRLAIKSDVRGRILKNAEDVVKGAVSSLAITATLRSNGSCFKMLYRPNLKRFFNNDAAVSRYSAPTCQQLRFVRTVNLANCTAQVHQRLNIEGHFLIEPLLCYNINSMSSESLVFDYSLDKYYVKLDLVLQDDASLDAVRTQLADLSPRSVEFMRLWDAESIVDPVLSAQAYIRPIMLSADGRSAQIRMICNDNDDCRKLWSAVVYEPVDLWMLIRWRATSMTREKCTMKSVQTHFSWRMRDTSVSSICVRRLKKILNPGFLLYFYSNAEWASLKGFLHQLPDGRCFIKIQQQMTGSKIAIFLQVWHKYEDGFGSQSDFWIGLSAIHALTRRGATLRLEMKLWNGTELHAEYAGFRVGDASSKYVMTYQQMLRNRSNVGFDAMEKSKGARFSTADKDNDSDGSHTSCSSRDKSVGWWYTNCTDFSPNAPLPSIEVQTWQNMTRWYSGSKWEILREVRLMVQI